MLVQLITWEEVNAQDEDGSTALHLACESWRILKIVKFLINDMKANLHSVDKEGRTPLHVACQSDFPQVLVPKFLVSKGANVLAKDKNGKTPLQIAKDCCEKDLSQYLNDATKR